MSSKNNDVIQVEGLKLKFPGERTLQFDSLRFTVRDGEKVLLIGPSGCGKSTLLQVLGGLIPHSIEVPMKADKLMLPSSVGYVFQDPDTQFCMPYMDEELAFVLENRGIPRERMAELISGALDKVGLGHLPPHTPIQELSQGMKQRLAIANVYLLEPEVWFLDEPTALLDEEGTEQIWNVVRAVTENTTVVIVEHKTEQVVDFVDRVVYMNKQGEMEAEGPPYELFRTYRRTLGEAGIWYPGIWGDYINSEAYQSISSNRQQSRHPLETTSAPRIQLEQFVAHRKSCFYPLVAEAHLNPGEWVTIMGPNGAGKSTLLLALRQLLRTTGEYRLHGQRVTPQTDLASEISFVFQNPELQFIEGTVMEEMALGLLLQKVPQEQAETMTAEWISRFGLQGKEQLHPYLLSLGQKRRLSVASALIRTQKILLLDEPTFGQDAQNTFSLLEEIEKWRLKGTTILMVTHDSRIVDHFATRIWEMRNGALMRDEAAPSFKQAAGV
jgi:energy-coupling factor transporter ATP-binding protein EcfA2